MSEENINAHKYGTGMPTHAREYILAHYQQENKHQLAEKLRAEPNQIQYWCEVLRVKPITPAEQLKNYMLTRGPGRPASEIALERGCSRIRVVQLAKELGITLLPETGIPYNKPDTENSEAQDKAAAVKRVLDELRARCNSPAEFREAIEAKLLMAEWADQLTTNAEGKVVKAVKRPRFKDKYNQTDFLSPEVRAILEDKEPPPQE